MFIREKRNVVRYSNRHRQSGLRVRFYCLFSPMPASPRLVHERAPWKVCVWRTTFMFMWVGIYERVREEQDKMENVEREELDERTSSSEKSWAEKGNRRSESLFPHCESRLECTWERGCENDSSDWHTRGWAHKMKKRRGINWNGRKDEGEIGEMVVSRYRLSRLLFRFCLSRFCSNPKWGSFSFLSPTHHRLLIGRNLKLHFLCVIST